MGYVTQFATNTVSNTNLNAATLVATITNTTRIRKLTMGVFADQVKGGGDYVAYVMIQRAGAGSLYESVKTTKTVAAGVTSIYFGSIPIDLNATDVMTVYLLGLATDNDGTADVIVDVNEEWIDIDASGHVVSASVVAPVTTTYQVKKNTALANFEFPMFDSALHNPALGLVVTGEVSLDGAAFVALTNVVAELSSGVYKVNLAAADLNANVLTLKFTAPGADTQFVTIVTQT